MKVEVTHIPYSEVVNDELLQGNIDNDEYEGFLEDYRTLHCLMRLYKPKRVCESGTNLGKGTKIIKNALGEDSVVYTLDLPTELAHISLQHPINEGKGDAVGSLCDLPFIQLRGDARTFDFSSLDCDGFWIDSEHTTETVLCEVTSLLKGNPKLVAFHDSNMPEVYDGIIEGFSNSKNGKNYQLYRVDGTRVLFAVRK